MNNSHKYGCDLSKYQRGIDFNSIKKRFDFVILRIGFTGIGTGTLNADPCFESFYNQTRELEIDTGIYYYSTANTAKRGREEAEFVLKLLDGRKLEFPVYLDVENDTHQANRIDGVTEAINAFCQTMLNGGYMSGVTAPLWWYGNYIDVDRLKPWSKWVCAYRQTPPKVNFPHFDIWQNTDDESVDNYRIDTDICFTDLPEFIKTAGLNGYGMRGDVDGNGDVDSLDYAKVKRAVLGTYELTPEEKARADVNGDGKIDSLDYATIKRSVLK